MNNRFSLALFAPAFTLALPLTLRADSPADQLRTQEAHQQQVRSQTQQIADQINLIISEFDRNGMSGGQDVKTLRSIDAVLEQLSAEQMQKVIELLQQARGAADGGLGDEKQAYLQQQGIIGKFRELLTAFEKEQSLYALADRFEHLARQQAANLRSAVDLAQSAAGKRIEQLDPASLAALQAQQAEQSTIATDVKDALNAVSELHDATSGADADQLNKAIDRAQTTHLANTVIAAASDLQTADLYRAAGGEKDARDALRQLADLLSPPKTPLEIRKDQLAKIDASLEKQKQIADHAKDPHADQHTNPVDHQAARAQADRLQAANVDDTDESRQQLQTISPAAAQDLKLAEAKMQQARSDAQQHRRDRTATDATAAADNLQLARDALAKEIAQNDADAAKPASDPAQQPVQQAEGLQKAQEQLNQLQEAQQQVADLIKKQAEVAIATAQSAANPTTRPTAAPADPDQVQPPQAQQQQVANQTAAAQPQIPPQAPAAASALNDARQQMQQAAQQIAQSQTPTAQASQAQAMTDLGKAAVNLASTADQFEAKLGQQPDDSAAKTAIDQAGQELKEAQSRLDQAQSGQPAAGQDAEKSLAAAAKSAAEAMGKSGSQAASNALEEAMAQMNQAGAKAEQGQPGSAQKSAAAAQAAIAQAQAALGAPAPSPAEGDGQSASAAPSPTPPPPGQGLSESPVKGVTPSNAMGNGIGETPGNRAAQDGGARGGTAGTSAFVQLPPRDRQALQQSQAEKYPEEYGTMVEQYLRNLSDTDQK